MSNSNYDEKPWKFDCMAGSRAREYQRSSDACFDKCYEDTYRQLFGNNNVKTIPPDVYYESDSVIVVETTTHKVLIYTDHNPALVDIIEK